MEPLPQPCVLVPLEDPVKFVLYQEFHSHQDLTEALQDMRRTYIQYPECDSGLILRSVDARNTWILETLWNAHPVEIPPHFECDKYRFWVFESL